MEILLEERNTASLFKPKRKDEKFQGSSIFSSLPAEFFRSEFEIPLGLPFTNKDMKGTTIFISYPVPKAQADDYETGYYNDDYSIVAKAPITKAFKVKAKINSISRLQHKFFIDEDELKQLL